MHYGFGVTEIRVQVVPKSDDCGFIEYSGSPSSELFRKRVADLGNSITEISLAMKRHFDELDFSQNSAWAMDQVCLTFSLDLEAEAGVILAKAKSSAGFEVGITWLRKG